MHDPVPVWAPPLLVTLPPSVAPEVVMLALVGVVTVGSAAARVMVPALAVTTADPVVLPTTTPVLVTERIVVSDEDHVGTLPGTTVPAASNGVALRVEDAPITTTSSCGIPVMRMLAITGAGVMGAVGESFPPPAQLGPIRTKTATRTPPAIARNVARAPRSADL